MRRPPGREEARHEHLAAVNDAPDVHGEEPFGVPERCVGHRRQRPDAGIVAEDVDAPERGPGAVGERFDRRALRHVARGADAAHPRAREFRSDLRRARRIHVGHNDIRTARGERPADPAPDATRSPGDDGPHRPILGPSCS